MDLIRQIMFKMEDETSGFAPQDFSIEGHSEEEVLYHVWLLGDAGLMDVAVLTSMGASGPQARPVHLTSAGHDFLDAARSDTVWSQTMEKVKSIGGTVSLTILKSLLESAVKLKLGL